MKQRLCCSHTGASNSFLQLPINIIFPLPVCGLWDNAYGLVCMYEFMHTFMSVCISLYIIVYNYVCMCAFMYACVWRMTMSMSNGKKTVDLSWGKYLIFTGRQARFFTEPTNFTETVASVTSYVTTALPVNLVSVTILTKDFRVSLVLPRQRKKRQSDN